LSIFGIIIITIFAFVIYAALKIKNKTNRMLSIKNREIELQRYEISIKNDTLEKQKEEITAQKESLEDTNSELGKINVYLEKLSNRNVHTDLAIIVASGNGMVESINLGFFNMFGYSTHDFSDFFHSLSDWYSIEENEQLKHAIETKETINFEAIHKTKAELTVFAQTTIIPITDNLGNVIKILSIETEITKY
jgi:PAS domain-containing protein